MNAVAAPRRVLFLLSAARQGGNAEALARAAAAALPEETEQRWLRLDDLPLDAFVDVRHVDPGTYPPPAGHAASLAEATLWASDLVAVAPVYWYNLPASLKLYFDHWSGWMRVPGLHFRERMAGRTLWGITISSDDASRDAVITAPLAQSLELTAGYLRMAWGGLLVGHGNKPGDIAADTTALQQARTFLRPAA